MRIHHLELDTSPSSDSTTTTPAIAPGKSTLAEKIARFGRGTEPVQAHRDAPASDEARAEEQLLLISHDLPRGGGAPLPAPVQAKMSRALGADFSGVRVHEGEHAGAIGANALASGDDLHFAAGQYDPDSRAGQELIGHELAHVVQQRAGRVGPAAQASGLVDNAMEQEADTLGAQAAASSASRQVAGDGGYVYEQFADGAIEIVAGPKNVGKIYLPGDPVNKAITEQIGAFPTDAPAPAPSPEAPAPVPVEEGTGIPSLDEILTGIGQTVGGIVDGITGAIGDFFGTTPEETAPPTGEAPATEPSAPVEEPAAPPAAGVNLDEVAMGKAVAYYAANAKRFPSGVITAIAGKLGLPNTTEIDAEMIDAIAAYQAQQSITPVDGQAGSGTLTKMFGRDIRMAANAADESAQQSSAGMERVCANVVVTAAIKSAWAVLVPLLPASAVMTSGLRTWEDTVRILIQMVDKKAPTMIAKQLTTQTEIDTAKAQQDYGTLHRLANLDYDGEDWVVAGPGNSPHVTGYAFDVSGADLATIDAAVQQAAADPAFPLKKTIVESGNNCVHVELTGA